ncbi:endonuclease/exonuclease/phosphatase family protein [Solirubrobacter ginsenosidimutans]|uniref:Endonuclease/exonuclease/phosphatase family protein n=1 Tax=Solirubrobacter ginsenosidimutans TaxID=490573 RepID=A0A9X3MXP3_9ACTN|nr:endonuclease/exonuclease/phosphatase family protein [Solirubrobacter ginsenosidimutans]MDA0164680.1 endonuclease/exonuclease/phosphatase family protein [Solirubrobacter ginsenosidimutans]
MTWNLYHGRSPNPSGSSLLHEFAQTLAGWEWDVALLQEVPPWWPPHLAAAATADHREVNTSRNFGLALRKAVSTRNPDILKSNGGGANAILVRTHKIEAHRTQCLTWWPERRYAHAVRLEPGWVVNLHASTHKDQWARRDVDRALEAFPDAFLFGGDLNLKGKPDLPGLNWLGGNHVDHLYGHGAATYEVLDRGRLSDHPPVRVTL